MPPERTDENLDQRAGRPQDQQPDQPQGVSRRRVLAGLGSAVALGGVSGAVGTGLLGREASTATAAAPASVQPSLQLDPATESAIGSLLRRMTLAEKLGQLRLVGDETTARAALADGQLGGVFSVVGAAKLNALQRIAVEHTRLGIPLIFGLDVIHGYTTNFPIPLAQGSSFDPDVAAADARTSAAEARASGIHWTYAPMMDVSHEPRWGRIAEGNGEDPYLVSRFATAKVHGFQGAHNALDRRDTLAACAKHYVAYGQPEGGRDYNTTDMSIQRLHNFYLPPFRAAVDAGVATVMAGFNAINGVPAHGNVYALRDILKNRYGFSGFVVSDYTGIQELIPHGYAADGADAAAKGLTAGVDMEMVSTNYVQYGQSLLAQGRITMTEVDDAVRRILRIKYRLGLFDHPYVNVSHEVTAPTAATRAVSRRLAGRSMVLLKNRAGVLPLATSTRRIAVVGPLGEATYDLNGTWSGLGTGAKTIAPTTVADAIRSAAPAAAVTVTPGSDVTGSSRAGFAAAVTAARRADVAVLVVGETADLSGEASARSDIGLPGVQAALVRAVAATGTPTVVVLINGRPLDLSGIEGVADAVLEAWAPGFEGGNAIADVLFGTVNPGGKLPVTFPRAVGEAPFYYNHENTGRPPDPANKYTSKYLDLPLGPLYPFGYGLSYTTFEITDLRLSSTRLDRDGRLDVTARVRNTGAVAGDEVVQLYLHDPVASIVQPVRRLRGFRRVHLAPGQAQGVRFTLTGDDVGFYDNNARWVIEPGEIEVYVGNSSTATLQTTFTVR